MFLCKDKPCFGILHSVRVLSTEPYTSFFEDQTRGPFQGPKRTLNIFLNTKFLKPQRKASRWQKELEKSLNKIKNQSLELLSCNTTKLPLSSAAAALPARQRQESSSEAMPLKRAATSPRRRCGDASSELLLPAACAARRGEPRRQSRPAAPPCGKPAREGGRANATARWKQRGSAVPRVLLPTGSGCQRRGRCCGQRRQRSPGSPGATASWAEGKAGGDRTSG